MSNLEKRYSETEVIEQGLIPGITNRITLHRKRKARLIGFYRVGNKVFYGESHIAEFMARCERKAKGQGGGQ
ncbi:MAG: hypothetical protein HY011_04350 [Acidobacteria bacterium]|nr:hypothetical protein [Acidobacteriota bacterium]